VGIPIDEDGERAFKLNLEAGLLAYLSASAVDGIFARFEKSAGHIPIATEGSIARSESKTWSPSTMSAPAHALDP
jgi:hypothetical protein